MPDGENTTAPEATATTTTETGTSSGARSIDSFPPEAQDYIRRLRSENASHRTELKDARKAVEEFENAGKSELEKLEGRATTAERTVESLTLRLERYDVAAAKGLPLKYASRLQGATKEELEADADQLIKDFGIDGDGDAAGAGGSGFDGGVRRPVVKPKTMNGLIRQTRGR